MRIGMLVDAYKPYISGVTNFVDVNKRFLEKKGHIVYVFTFGDEATDNENGSIIRSPGLPITEQGFYLSFRYDRSAQKLLHTMDVLHVHHPFLSGQLAIRYARGRGIPILFTNHTRYDLYAKAYLSVLPDEVSESFLKTYLPPFCRAVDRVIAPSAGLRDVLVKLGVDAPITVVPNGVDMQRVQGEIQPINRQEYGVNEEDILLIYTGRLAPEKNLVFLIRAFAGVAQAVEEAHLLLVGDGPDNDNLVDRVRHMGLSDRIHFTGRVPYEDVSRYLHMADAFVTASVTEVHPLSVIEAMGAGLPVLGIVSPGVGDTVENGVTGYLTDSEDLPAFTAKMMKLVSDRARVRSLGASAREKSAQYDIRNTVNLMEEQYREALLHKKAEKQSLRARMLRMFDRWTG
jgi:glycosyltransferase involved in cell wall biosynthesis